MGLKVAIVGLAQSSRNQIPWGRDGWEFWGLGWDSERFNFHRVFEIHDREIVESEFGDGLRDYLDKLGACSMVYTPEKWADVPSSVAYPFDAVAQTCGGYWESSVAYMVSLAIHEGAEEIALYGVDMKGDDEYGYQKPNMEYLLGLAKGRGIGVFLPDVSPLLKHSGQFGHIGRYGRIK